MRLEQDQLVELAELVADALEQRALDARASVQLVDAAQLAARLGIKRDFVYAHADELGVCRLGDGPRARLRFDPDRAAERLASCSVGRESTAPASAPAVASRRRRSARAGTGVDLLPIRGANRG